MYLYGPPGNGKTYAALAGINYLTRRDNEGFEAGKDPEVDAEVGPKRIAYMGLMKNFRTGESQERRGNGEPFRDGITSSSIFPEGYSDETEPTSNIALIDDYLPHQRSFDGEDVLCSFARKVYDKGGLLIVTSNAEICSKNLV